MKSLSTLLFFKLIFFSFFCIGQGISYKQVQNSKTRPKGPFTEYVSKDGSIYQIGDTLNIGIPTLGRGFAFIEVVPNGEGMIRKLKIDKSYSQTKIINFRIDHSQRNGYNIVAKTTGPSESSHYIIEMEAALISGEIILKSPKK